MSKKIAIIATLDTKHLETEYLVGLFSGWGLESIVLDVGPLTAPQVEAGFTNAKLAGLAGWDLKKLIETGQRDLIMETMGLGAGKALKELLDQGGLAGAFGLGGNQGSAMAALAMKSLPLGCPKFLVSTVASGNIRPYVGHKDIAVMFSVGDMLGGPNMVTRSVLANAAAALAGMVREGRGLGLDSDAPAVALTELGNTEEAASRAVSLLQENGLKAIPFHASGAGGSAMEELIGMGAIQAVLDLTPHEISEEIVGGAYAPVRPGRLSAAGDAGLPQVVSFGGLEYVCFGPYESIPFRLRRRKIYMHNPLNANVKLSRPEMAQVGRTMAGRLSTAKGPVAVLVPQKGWSVYGSEGGPLYDPLGNKALLKAFKAEAGPTIEIIQHDLHINEPGFAELCVNKLIQLMEGKTG